MRLFIALNLPKNERARVYRASAALRDAKLPIRWIEPDNYHLTLKFLGEVHQDRVTAVEEIVQKVADGTVPFDISLGGFGAFPTIRKPRVVWMGIVASAELRCLKQDLEWGLADVGFEAETRAFHPHVTLGRADPKFNAGHFRGFDDIIANLTYEGGAQIRTLDLMRSHLSRDGARYSVVTSARLAGS
jgi:2'-5' RNA ligase